LSGSYGDNLSWWSNVTINDGNVRVNEPPITLRIWTNKTNYKFGDTLVLYYSITPNLSRELLKHVYADAYMVLKMPVARGGHRYYWHVGKRKFKGKMTPIIRSPKVPSFEGIAGWFDSRDGYLAMKKGKMDAITIDKLSSGTYTWYAVLVWTKRSPLKPKTWISNLATSQFTVSCN
jgi:hypothetical protein